MLNVVAGGEVHQVWCCGSHQLSTASQHMFTKNRAIDRLSFVFSRYTQPVESCAEQPSQLLLRCDDDDLRAGAGEGGRNGVGAEKARIIHHDGTVCLAIKKEIPRNSMSRWRHSRHNGQVVGIRETWDCRFCCANKSVF